MRSLWEDVLKHALFSSFFKILFLLFNSCFILFNESNFCNSQWNSSVSFKLFVMLTSLFNKYKFITIYDYSNFTLMFSNVEEELISCCPLI
jgi:hypothetical protein